MSGLDGLDFEPLPEGWTPLEAVMVVKALNADGGIVWCGRTTDSLPVLEQLGMLVHQRNMLEHDLLHNYLETGDDDDPL